MEAEREQNFCRCVRKSISISSLCYLGLFPFVHGHERSSGSYCPGTVPKRQPRETQNSCSHCSLPLQSDPRMPPQSSTRVSAAHHSAQVHLPAAHTTNGTATTGTDNHPPVPGVLGSLLWVLGRFRALHKRAAWYGSVLTRPAAGGLTKGRGRRKTSCGSPASSVLVLQRAGLVTASSWGCILAVSSTL